MIKKIKCICYRNGSTAYVIVLKPKFSKMMESMSTFYLIPKTNHDFYLDTDTIKTKKIVSQSYIYRSYLQKKGILSSLKKIKFTKVEDAAKFKLYY